MPYPRKDSRYWWASYTDASGKPVRRSTGTTDRKEAEALESKWRLEAFRQHQWGEEPAHSFDDLMLDYLTDTENKPSHERDLYSVKRLKEHFSEHSLPSLTPQDIADYKKKRRDDGVSDATIAKELGLFSAAINYARKEWGWKIENVVAKRIPSEPKKRIRWISREEADRLVAAVSPRAPYLRSFILLGLHTGMRKSELLGLEWSRVDFEHKLIYLDPDDQKNRRSGSVPLNPIAVAALRQLEGQHDRWVFTFRKKRLQSVKKAFAAACKRAGIEDFTPHGLRHTCTAWMVQEGVPLRSVAEVLRHEDIRTTMRYAHLSPKSARGAVAALMPVAERE